MRLCWCECIVIQTSVIMWRCSYICTTRRDSLGNERDFFFSIYCLSQWRYREYDPEGFLCFECVCLCECARVWTTCSQYTRRAFLMAVHSLTFGQTSCRYMSSSGWSQVNLARFLVIILPAAKHALWDSGSGRYSANFPPQDSNPWNHWRRGLVRAGGCIVW